MKTKLMRWYYDKNGDEILRPTKEQKEQCIWAGRYEMKVVDNDYRRQEK